MVWGLDPGRSRGPPLLRGQTLNKAERETAESPGPWAPVSDGPDDGRDQILVRPALGVKVQSVFTL